jgi:DNA-directed RNA polymerase specialized sigma24 family protein
MTAAAFAALARLLRLRPGGAQDAARLVLVEGMRPTDAAALSGVSPASASNTITRMRRGLELARTAGAP